MPPDIQWLVMTLAMLGKLCNSGAFMIIFVYMSEVLPTEVRLQGVGATIMTCQLGATIAPYITDYVVGLAFGFGGKLYREREGTAREWVQWGQADKSETFLEIV